MLISAAAPAEKVLVFMNPAVTVKENYEFRRIYRKGKSAVSPQLVIYCQRNRRGLSRLGVSVSTKLGGAVVRNRVRRRIREIYRLNKPKMVPGYDIIVVARVRAVETGYQKLESTYLRLLRQLDLLREDPS
jgi:ribonuclease P protein component